jgi:hypothetical protein
MSCRGEIVRFELQGWDWERLNVFLNTEVTECGKTEGAKKRNARSKSLSQHRLGCISIFERRQMLQDLFRPRPIQRRLILADFSVTENEDSF